MGGRRGGARTRRDEAWAVLGAGGCRDGAGKVPGRRRDGARTRASAIEGVWDAGGGGNGILELRVKEMSGHLKSFSRRDRQILRMKIIGRQIPVFFSLQNKT